jgi:hypothetical protein
VAWHYFVLLGCFMVWLCSCLGAVTLQMTIVDGLNSRRSADDQIPISNERLQATAWWMRHFARHGPFSYYRVLLPEYRREFPASRAPAWYVTCVIVTCLDAAASLLLIGKWLR